MITRSPVLRQVSSPASSAFPIRSPASRRGSSAGDESTMRRGDTHPPAAADAVRFVVVQRDLLGEEDRKLLERLQADPAWRTRLDRDNVVVLERPGPIP